MPHGEAAGLNPILFRESVEAADDLPVSNEDGLNPILFRESVEARASADYGSVLIPSCSGNPSRLPSDRHVSTAVLIPSCSGNPSRRCGSHAAYARCYVLIPSCSGNPSRRQSSRITDWQVLIPSCSGNPSRHGRRRMTHMLGLNPILFRESVEARRCASVACYYRLNPILFRESVEATASSRNGMAPLVLIPSCSGNPSRPHAPAPPEQTS